MTTLLEAAKQALEALLGCAPCHNEQGTVRQAANAAITALRQAIEQAEKQEQCDWSLLEATQESLREHMAEIGRLKAIIAEAEKQEPVAWVTDLEFDRETELIPAKRKGKLGTKGMTIPLYTTPPAAPVQEPCQYAIDVAMPEHRCVGKCQYAAQREWVGLNWDDLPEIYVGDTAFMHGAKWAEAKLKEKNNGQR
jgi:hypothetical protein